MNFSFGIVTADDRYAETLVRSILYQKIPNFEIIIVGSNRLSEGPIRYIPFDESVKKGWITKKKNIITQEARYENIVYLHDYLVLSPNWYAGFCTFGDDFKICMTPIINLDGTRYRDWTLFPHFLPEDLRHRRDLLLPYNVKGLSRFQYISGAYWVAKKEVMQENPLNEDLVWGESEDVEWSRVIKEKYKFSINIHSVVQITKPGKDRAFSEAQEDIISNLISRG